MKSGMFRFAQHDRVAVVTNHESLARACQTNLPVARFSTPMKLTAIFCAALVSTFCAAFAQTPAPESAKPADAAQVEALAKKIDEQNAKIDALSQEILKLEQQIAHIRPGIIIGENTPSPGTSPAPAASASHPGAAGNTHIVARGETLTSIAKMYKVTV